MPYLSEEVAVLEGLIRAYLISPKLPESLRRDYITVHQHMEQDALTQHDYQRIHSAVDFLLPMHKASPSEYKLIVGVLTKTTSMLAAH